MDQVAKQDKSPKDIVVSVIAQVYTYMIDSGVQYPHLTRGEAFILVDFPDRDRQTITYSLVIAKAVFTNVDNDVPRTTIGQVLSFCILACRRHDSN